MLSRATPSDGYAVAIKDSGSWHQYHLADEFNNLSIFKLPPYSPELNPVEQVWQWMRQNEISNRCFTGYEDIVEQCANAWNQFWEYRSRITKMCDRDWINMHLANL